MTISLKIDNLDRLPDGGPVRYEAQNRGFEIGREDRDWTLPDPNMFVSGRHCEVRYEKGGYWLYDVSRNGTFVNGSTQRVKSPYQLQNGDRLQIGHYYVTVSIEGASAGDARQAGPFSAPAAPPASSDNIWDIGGPALPPIDRRELMPPQSRGRRSADFSEQFLELPPVAPSFDGDPFGNPAPNPASPFSSPAPSRPQPEPSRQQTPFAFPFESEPFVPTPAAAPPPPPQRPAAAPMPRPAGAPQPFQQPGQMGSGQGDAILRAIAAGAGVSPDVFLHRDAQDVAADIGIALRTVVEELSLLLKARAAAKVMARAGNRTMISAVDNNPLKFVPRAEEVLEIMFTRKRAGYLDAKQSLDEAFRDLKTHEFATYAAMQTALGRLLEDLSPEAIEKKVPSSAFASKKPRAWDLFVATWDAKEKPNENGMLDVFLGYFSDAYAKASKPK